MLTTEQKIKQTGKKLLALAKSADTAVFTVLMPEDLTAKPTVNVCLCSAFRHACDGNVEHVKQEIAAALTAAKLQKEQDLQAMRSRK